MAVTIESTFDLNAEYQAGRLVSLNRELRVSGLTSTNADAYTAELINAGVIPTTDIIIAGSKLRHEGYSIRIGDDVPLGDAIVTLKYRVFDEQDDIEFSASGGLKQIATEFDLDGAPITVEHTYPADAKGNLADNRQKAGATDIQGGSIQMLLPTYEITGSYRAQVANADGVITKWLGHCNSETFRGKPEYTWLCIAGGYRLIDRSVTPYLFEFTFTLAHDPEGWDNDTTAVYIDPSTNAPPPELVDGAGRKKIRMYPTVDFNQSNP